MQQITNLIALCLELRGYDVTQCMFTMEGKDIYAEVEVEDIKSSSIVCDPRTSDQSVVGTRILRNLKDIEDIVIFFSILIMMSLLIIVLIIGKLSEDIKEVRPKDLQQVSSKP